MYSSESLKKINQEAVQRQRKGTGVDMFMAEEDGDKKVFSCKMLLPEALEDFEEVERYFVDSSGWGQDDQPAITAEQFLKKVKKNKFYAIIECGQFQVWIGEYTKK